MAVVGAPAYFATRPIPKTPHDLTQHACINIRLQTLGGLYVWEFGKNGRELNIRVDGPLVFNSVPMVLKAVTDGFGLACLVEDQVTRLVAKGTFVRVLEDWCPPFPGYHLYYPSRRQSSPAFTLLAEILRYRAK
jgi:DNA-binding transcriptional LysR family regulator